MKDETRYAIRNSPSHGPIVGRGPTFAGGSGHDMLVNGSTVYINPGHSFTAGHLLVGTMISNKWKIFLWPDRLLR